MRLGRSLGGVSTISDIVSANLSSAFHLSICFCTVFFFLWARGPSLRLAFSPASLSHEKHTADHFSSAFQPPLRF